MDFRTPVSDEDRRRMIKCLDEVKRQFPGKGFAVFVFDFGEAPPNEAGHDSAMHWGSNAEREDMLKALQEFLRAQAS